MKHLVKLYGGPLDGLTIAVDHLPLTVDVPVRYASYLASDVINLEPDGSPTVTYVQDAGKTCTYTYLPREVVK